MVTFVPPSEIFQIPPQSATERMAQGGYSLDGFEKLTRSESGGMLSHYAGHPFPRKGMIYPEGVLANNQVKRITLALFMPLAGRELIFAAAGLLLTPWRWKIRVLERVLLSFNRLADSIYLSCTRVPYFKKAYYCEFSKAVWEFVYYFLTQLGVSAEVAERTGLIIATLFEFDDAYKVRVQDLCNETSADALLRNPRQELSRLFALYCERDPHHEEVHAGGRILAAGKLLSAALLIPKIKRAFKDALLHVKFSDLQMDESDYYWALPRQDYMVGGRPFEERFNEHVSIVAQHLRETTGEDVTLEWG